MTLPLQGEGHQFESGQAHFCESSIVASIRRCQRCDPGSNPGSRIHNVYIENKKTNAYGPVA